MSGGHFDYQQYHIEDIANSIEREIKDAQRPKPKKIMVNGVRILKRTKENISCTTDFYFGTYEEAVDFFSIRSRYKLIEESVKGDRRYSTFLYGDGNKYEVIETKYEEFEDGNYYPEYSEETIRLFKEGVKALRKAAIYAQRIDWLISGDDGEDNFKERLNDELKELEANDEQ